jgi:hypothetical protein
VKLGFQGPPEVPIQRDEVAQRAASHQARREAIRSPGVRPQRVA